MIKHKSSEINATRGAAKKFKNDNDVVYQIGK